MDTMKTETDVAVKWWTDVLRKPAKFDNGDKSETGGLTSGLAMIGAARGGTVTEEQLEVFAKTLRGYIETDWESQRQKGWDCRASIYCDYGPDHRLYESAKLAGIDNLGYRFPWKTCMNIHPGSVKVAEGYGAPYVDLMPQ